MVKRALLSYTPARSEMEERVLKCQQVGGKRVVVLKEEAEYEWHSGFFRSGGRVAATCQTEIDKFSMYTLLFVGKTCSGAERPCSRRRIFYSRNIAGGRGADPIPANYGLCEANIMFEKWSN